jgi:hypothetical protein
MLSELLQFRSETLTDKLAQLKERCLQVLNDISTSPELITEDKDVIIPSEEAEIDDEENITEDILPVEKEIATETSIENLDDLFDLGF